MELGEQLSLLGLSEPVLREALLSRMPVPATDVVPDSAEQASSKPTLWVGLSGGLDSCVLLSLLNDFWAAHQAGPMGSRQGAFELPFNLAAIHVNHQLQVSAGAWARWCQAWCAERQIPLVIATVSLDAEQQAQQGIEAAARAARYAAFGEHAAADDLIALAHHADDQVETILMRWLRGAGSEGLAGMLENATHAGLRLWRPLLCVPREAIERLGHALDLNWQEDPSNADVRFDRNFLRHQVIPLLKARWPATLKTVARSGQQAADASEQNTAFADRLIDQAAQQQKNKYGCDRAAFPLHMLEGFSSSAQITLLRRWLMREGCTDVSTAMVRSIFETVVRARADAQPKFVANGWCVRRFREQLFLTAAQLMDDVLPEPVVWYPEECPRLTWCDGYLLCTSPETAAELLKDVNNDIGGKLEVTVVARDGVEPGQLPRRLKQRFQEHAIPPWQRGCWPVLFAGSTLIGVAGVWAYQERMSSQLFYWQPAE